MQIRVGCFGPLGANNTIISCIMLFMKLDPKRTHCDVAFLI